MGVKTIIRRLYYLTKQLGYMLSGKPHAKGFIFCMHRVSDLEDGKIIWNENMKIPPSDLDRIITYVKERYDIIRLEDVPMRMKEKHKRKFVVFSLDDGYKDNYYHALKVFQKHDVPFTVFLCSDFMDRKAILWWYTLEDIVLTNETVTLGNGKIFNCKTKTDKELAFLKIREEILKLEQVDLENQIKSLFCNYSFDLYKKNEELCMSWEDVKQMTKERLVTLGAHTEHHFNLAKLPTKQAVKDEILSGLDKLQKYGNVQTSVFAYPYGSPTEVGSQVEKALEELSDTFILAVGGTSDKFVTDRTKDNYLLPRFMLEKDFTDISLMRIPNVYVL